MKPSEFVLERARQETLNRMELANCAYKKLSGRDSDTSDLSTEDAYDRLCRTKFFAQVFEAAFGKKAARDCGVPYEASPTKDSVSPETSQVNAASGNPVSLIPQGEER
jgi:hypothetical protein